MRMTIPAIALGAISAMGCSRSAITAATAAAPSRAPDARSIAIAYSVARRGPDGDGVVLAGRTALEMRRGVEVQEIAARSPARAELSLDARGEPAGGVLVVVRYKETAADGSRIEWEPIVRVAPGAPAHAEVSGAGWSRTIEVAME